VLTVSTGVVNKVPVPAGEVGDGVVYHSTVLVPNADIVAELPEQIDGDEIDDMDGNGLTVMFTAVKELEPHIDVSFT
jgi:hypothetical protein